MRTLLCYLIFAAGLHANTCALALTANRLLSATTTLWTGAGCTAAVPGAGDTATVTGAFSLTVDQAWTIGNYGNPVLGYVYGVNNTVPTTLCSAGCTATVSGGTVTGTLPATASCSQSGGAATIALTTRGFYTARSEERR